MTNVYTYLIGNPKVLPFFTNVKKATAFNMNPIPDNIVSTVSKISDPDDLKGEMTTLIVFFQ